MKDILKINKTIKPFNKKIQMEGDKSLSIRWALIASQANGKSTSYNLLKSEDVISTLNCLKKLGVKVKNFKNRCEILGVGLNGFKYKKNLTLDCGNSGTLSRLILLLVHSKSESKLGIKFIKRFSRITDPLKSLEQNLN